MINNFSKKKMIKGCTLSGEIVHREVKNICPIATI